MSQWEDSKSLYSRIQDFSSEIIDNRFEIITKRKNPKQDLNHNPPIWVPRITVQSLNYIGQDRTHFLRETIVKFRFKSDSVNFYGFCYIRRMKILKVPTIWFDNVNNIKFKQEKSTGSVFLGLLNAASSCPIIFCLHVRANCRSGTDHHVHDDFQKDQKQNLKTNQFKR